MPQFIHEQFIEDVGLADKFVAHFHNNPQNHSVGKTEGLEGPEVTYFKKSTEIAIESEYENELSTEVCRQLQIVLDEYVRIYERVNHLDRFNMVPFNIQYYKPGEGFLQWHTERGNGLQPSTSRVLVWMMYCNTIEREYGGGTEFYYQDYTCQAEKGKIVIWPADWTFTHRGSKSQKEKMILTGWYNFANIGEDFINTRDR